MSEPHLDFSIITPSRNYGDYIGECLESVALQKGVTFEHLVIDCASTDHTWEVVKNYPHAFFSSEKDEGMSEGINRGFRLAKGKWVMWLNADDRLKPGALAEVKEFAEKNSELDVIYGGWDFVDCSLSLIKIMNVFPLRKIMLAQMGCYIGSTACFYRKETTLDKGYLLNEEFHYVMDGEYYSRLAADGKIFGYLPVRLADFRLHDGNQSLRNYKTSGVSGQLRFENQLAESRAIRRIYGVKWLTNPYLNDILDACLYFWFRMVKATLKLRYRKNLRLPRK